MLSASNSNGLYSLESRDRYVYHYTRSEIVLKILSSGKIRMGLFTKTNDPRENKDWLFGVETRASQIDLSGEEFEKLQREATTLAKNTCKLLCLTEDDDGAVGGPAINKIYGRGFCRPRMWAQYADKNKGVCLIFDRERLRTAINASVESSSLLLEDRVTYRNRSQAPSWRDNPFVLDYDTIRRDGLNTAIRELIERHQQGLFFEKATDWADEKEFRWVVWDTSREEHLVPFGESLRCVVVGPNFDDSLGPGLHEDGEKYDFYVAKLRWTNGVPEVLGAWWEPTAMRERRAPRLSDLKRAMRWLRAQYQRRAEEAARGQDRVIEHIRKTRGKSPKR